MYANDLRLDVRSMTNTMFMNRRAGWGMGTMDERILMEFRLADVNERLAERRAEADAERLVREGRPAARGLRERLGELLIAAGTAIEGETVDRSPAQHAN